MYICTLQHTKNKITSILSKVNSFTWELQRTNDKQCLSAGNELIDYLKKDIDRGILEIIDGSFPVVDYLFGDHE